MDNNHIKNVELHNYVLYLLFENIIDSDLANKLHAKIDKVVKIK